MGEKLGIEKTIEFIEKATRLVIDILTLIKGGFGWSSATKLIGLLGKVKDLLVGAKAVLPELKDLDGQEAVELGAAAYEAITKIVSAA